MSRPAQSPKRCLCFGPVALRAKEMTNLICCGSYGNSSRDTAAAAHTHTHTPSYPAAATLSPALSSAAVAVAFAFAAGSSKKPKVVEREIIVREHE